MEQLSLRQKIGQMFICGFEGTEPSEGTLELIEKYHLGGIIYFRRNIANVNQIRQLSLQLQQANKKHSDIPLLISIDQEGGMVARIDQGLTLMPGNMALGATRDVEGVFQAALISGKELRHLGINMNFAPCLDINNNSRNPVIGVRSYGERAELVSEMGKAAIRGYQQSGVAATAKHFPGHGDTETDSHLGLPIIKHDEQRLREMELVPFVGAIEAEVDAIMTAHVVFPAFEKSDVPATLSYSVLTGLLRNQLKFEGVIVTDCLEMKAISDKYGTDQGAVMAVEAGADLVLVSHTLDRQAGAIEALVCAVESGRISESRIDESVARILRLKQKRNMGQWAEGEINIQDLIGLEEDRKVAERLNECAVTLVKDEKQLPLADKKTYVVWTEVREGTEVDEVINPPLTLGMALKGSISAVEEYRMGMFPTEDEIEQVITKSSGYDQIVFVSYNATFSPGQKKLVGELAKRDEAVFVVAATRNPYDLLEFPEVKTYLACYENRPLAMRALANVLLGKAKAQGKLPVTISAQYPYGWSVPFV